MIKILLPVFITTTFLITGCENKTPPAQVTPQSPQSKSPVPKEQSYGFTSSNACFNLQTDLPAQATLNQPVTFALTIASACITPEKIDSIHFFADMPAHGHGLNSTPTIARLDATHFKIDNLILHMPGAWRATFEINHGGKLEIAELDFSL